jgi:hypothetical protein
MLYCKQIMQCVPSQGTPDVKPVGDMLIQSLGYRPILRHANAENKN